MANTKAHLKTIIKDEQRKIRNRALRTKQHSAIRKLEEAQQGDDAGLTASALKDAIQRIDRNVSKGVLHPKTGARKKSRLSASVKKTA